MVKRLILGLLGGSSLLILFSSLIGGEIAALVFAGLAVTFPVLLMLAGAEKGGRLGRALPVLSIVLLLLALGLAAMLLLRPRGVDAPLVLGLPPAAAVQIYGLGLAPLVVVGLGFAWAFAELAPDREDLARLRDAGRREDAD